MRAATVLLALVLLLAACGGGEDDPVQDYLDTLTAEEREPIEVYRRALRGDPEALAAYDALVLAFAGFGDGGFEDGQPPKPVVPLAIGESVVVQEDVELSLDDAFWQGRITMQHAGEGFSTYFEPDGRFLVVPFTIQHASESDVDPDQLVSSFYVEDDLGRQTRSSLLSVDEYSVELWDVPMADVIRAGRVGRGIMFFDVDREAPGTVLRSDELGLIVDVAAVVR